MSGQPDGTGRGRTGGQPSGAIAAALSGAAAAREAHLGLAREEDPFGAAYQVAYEHGGEPGAAHLVYELADGFIYAEDAAEYFTSPDGWLPVDRSACSLVRGRILDVGCGAGRHSAVLTAEGHDVHGVDPSPGAVRVARARGVDARIGSVPELPDSLGSFDTFVMLGANLGLLGRPEHSSRVLARLAALARPGARLLGTNMDMDMETGPAADPAAAPADGPFVRMRVRHGTAATPWFDFMFCSPERLTAAVAGTPWTVTDVQRDTDTRWPTYLAQLQLTG